MELIAQIEKMLNASAIMSVAVADFTKKDKNGDVKINQFRTIGKVTLTRTDKDFVFEMGKKKIKLPLADDWTMTNEAIGAQLGFPRDEELHEMRIASHKKKMVAVIKHLPMGYIKEAMENFDFEKEIERPTNPDDTTICNTPVKKEIATLLKSSMIYCIRLNTDDGEKRFRHDNPIYAYIKKDCIKFKNETEKIVMPIADDLQIDSVLECGHRFGYTDDKEICEMVISSKAAKSRVVVRFTSRQYIIDLYAKHKDTELPPPRIEMTEQEQERFDYNLWYEI